MNRQTDPEANPRQEKKPEIRLFPRLSLNNKQPLPRPPPQRQHTRPPNGNTHVSPTARARLPNGTRTPPQRHAHVSPTARARPPNGYTHAPQALTYTRFQAGMTYHSNGNDTSFQREWHIIPGRNDASFQAGMTHHSRGT